MERQRFRVNRKSTYHPPPEKMPAKASEVKKMSPQRRVPSPQKRAQSPQKRAQSPQKRAQSSQKRISSPQNRGSSPQKRYPSSQKKRDPSPQKRDPTPQKRVPSSQKRTITATTTQPVDNNANRHVQRVSRQMPPPEIRDYKSRNSTTKLMDHNVNHTRESPRTRLVSPQRNPPNVSNTAINADVANVNQRVGIYPTLSSDYRRENLDYSPPEPTADYPYTDEFPLNNIYPDLNSVAPREIIVEESVTSNVDNTLEQNALSSVQIVDSASNNLNINVPETKVLNDKFLEINSSSRVETSANNETELYWSTTESAIENSSAPPFEETGPSNVSYPVQQSTVIKPEGVHRPDRNNFQKKCDASKFIDENTPTFKFPDEKLPIKMKTADKHFEFDTPPKADADFDQWMTWRKQVNRHMASMILIKQGKDVFVAPSEVNRKPLAKSAMKKVIIQSRDDMNRPTSLDGKPYVMYGIPRAKLTG